MAFKTTISKPSEINFEVLEECGDLCENSKGEVLKLRYISWNGRDPKYDLRYWYTDDTGEEKMRKGITLTGEELQALCERLKQIESAE